MAGIFNGPPRGGTRGGRSEFQWEDVKSSADREYYLGHSVKALAGRWQKGKDVYWYTKDKDGENSEAARQHELQLVKQREEELMMEALGMKPRAPKHVQTSNRQQLDSIEMKKLLSTSGDQDEDAPAPGQQVMKEERVRGLGYAAGGFHGGESRREILGGVGVSGTDAYGGGAPSRTERERDHGRRSRVAQQEEHERDGRHRRREKKRHRKEIGRKSSRRSRSRSRERSHRRRREHRE
eukprot:jgi/Picsp_1/4927/NSC_02291-R1_t-complex protein 1 subunit zeta